MSSEPLKNLPCCGDWVTCRTECVFSITCRDVRAGSCVVVEWEGDEEDLVEVDGDLAAEMDEER